MDCLVTVFMDEFWNFSTFSVILLVLGHLECSSSSADTLPSLKHECHSETYVWLKECSPKASRSIPKVSVADLPAFTQSLMQTRCSILASIADKTKRSRKSTRVETVRVHSVITHG
jgi:hypothetical protein